MSDTITDKRSETARALIGQCLWKPEKVSGSLAGRVTQNDMPQPWGAVWELVKSGITDVPMIAMRLPEQTLMNIGGDIELSALNVYGAGDHAEEHAKNLLSYSARVRIVEHARELQAAAMNPDIDPDTLARQAVENFSQVGIDTVDDFEPVGKMIREEIAAVREAAKNPRDVWGIPIGLPKFDMITGGMQQGEFSLLIGEPGLGKTWLAMGAAVDMGAHFPGVVLSMEMKKKAQARRLLSGKTGVQTRAMKSGRITSAELDKLDKAAGIFDELPVYFNDRSVTTDQLRAMLSRAKTKYGIRWAWIDYLMLFGNQARDEIAFTAQVSRDLKTIATTLDLAVCCIHSVVKSGMDSDDDPTKSNARGSGQLIHDADLVMNLTKFKPLPRNDREKLIPESDREKMAVLWTTKGRELDTPKNRDILRRKGESPFWGEATI